MREYFGIIGWLILRRDIGSNTSVAVTILDQTKNYVERGSFY